MTEQEMQGMTEEQKQQYRILIEQGLIGPQEKSAVRTAELAKGLLAHPAATNKRMDVGSQIGRAGAMGASALASYRSGVAEQAGLTERQAKQMKLANLMRAKDFAGQARAEQARAAASGVSGAITPGMGTMDDDEYWGYTPG